MCGEHPEKKRGRPVGTKNSPKVERICKYCKKYFMVHAFKINKGEGIYCSIRCCNRGKKYKSKKIRRICEYCKKYFKVYPFRIKNGHGKYCSRKCYLAATAAPEQPCKNKGCKNKIKTSPSKIKKGCGAYCSTRCKNLDSTIIERICQNNGCKNKVPVYPSRIKKGHGKYCSIECFQKARASKEATLYLIELRNPQTRKFYAYKIGFTSHTVKKRFSRLPKTLKYKTILTHKSTTGDIISLEQYIIQKFKPHKKYGSKLCGKTGGASECFNQSLDIEAVKKVINKGVRKLSQKKIIEVLTHGNLTKKSNKVK